MLTKANIRALDQLLLERYGGKVGRGPPRLNIMGLNTALRKSDISDISESTPCERPKQRCFTGADTPFR